MFDLAHNETISNPECKKLLNQADYEIGGCVADAGDLHGRVFVACLCDSVVVRVVVALHRIGWEYAVDAIAHVCCVPYTECTTVPLPCGYTRVGRYYSYNLYDDCTYKNFMKGEEHVSAPARGKRAPRNECVQEHDTPLNHRILCIAPV